jgi:hypothetical protein
LGQLDTDVTALAGTITVTYDNSDNTDAIDTNVGSLNVTLTSAVAGQSWDPSPDTDAATTWTLTIGTGTLKVTASAQITATATGDITAANVALSCGNLRYAIASIVITVSAGTDV